MELEITIGPDGGVKLHVKGVKGKACTDITNLFKKLVGPETKQQLTPEYYEPDTHIKGDLRHT